MTTRTDHRFALNIQRGARSESPGVHISLQRVVRHANGMLAVTPVCSSLPEIEHEIAELKRELEDVLRQARQAFAVKSATGVS